MQPFRPVSQPRLHLSTLMPPLARLRFLIFPVSPPLPDSPHTFSQYTTLRPITPMLWDQPHPMPTIGPVIRLVEYARTADISSTRMAVYATFVG
jgi:hypothetical protein